MTTIDSIVRKALLEKELPIHYYVLFLSAALESLREIHFDVIANTRTAKLTLNEFNEAPLPEDYIDWIRVGVPSGRHIVPLGVNSSFNLKTNISSTGVRSSYGDSPQYLEIGNTPFSWGGFYNSYGESVGRHFNTSGKLRNDEFQVDRQRWKVIAGQYLVEDDVIYMDYISDSPAHAASLVHPYAETTIQAFIWWRYSANQKLGDQDRRKREFYNQLRTLRARIDPITKEEIIRLYRASVQPTTKG